MGARSGAQHAREELRERCLALVRRWQPLAQGGWDQIAARMLGEEIDQIADSSERLGLEDVNGSALELAAYLCSFVDDRLVPNARDLGRLADMVNRMGAVLTDLSATETAAVHTLPGARTPPEPLTPTEADAPAPAATAVIAPPESAAAQSARPAGPESAPRPTHLPRAVCMARPSGLIQPPIW